MRVFLFILAGAVVSYNFCTFIVGLANRIWNITRITQVTINLNQYMSGPLFTMWKNTSTWKWTFSPGFHSNMNCFALLCFALLESKECNGTPITSYEYNLDKIAAVSVLFALFLSRCVCVFFILYSPYHKFIFLPLMLMLINGIASK